MEERMERARIARILAHETRTLVRLDNGKLAVIVRLFDGRGELVDWRLEGRVEDAPLHR